MTAPSIPPSDPSNDDGKGPRWGQERRLQFIDFRLQWEGRIRRADLMSFFGISMPQASADMKRYQDAFPGNMRYDGGEKYYVPSEAFVPRFPATGPRQYLAQLLALERGILPPQDAFFGQPPPMASAPNPVRTVDQDTLKKLVRAINERASLEIDYQSVSRPDPTSRRISPHAFGHDGMRWHIRAYCHMREEFRDFVVGRIVDIGGAGPSNVSSIQDDEWWRELTLILEPHPRLNASQRRGIEMDYGMHDGRSTMTCKQAMLLYTLRRLGLDNKGEPRQKEQQVVIANLADIALYLPKDTTPG